MLCFNGSRRDARADAHVLVGLLHPRAQLVQLVAHELGLPNRLLLRLCALQRGSSISRRRRTAACADFRRTRAHAIALVIAIHVHVHVLQVLFSLSVARRR